MSFRKDLSSLFKLNYAETHYKFKLPWSLLYKKEPEIFLDAPFQVVPEEKLRIYAIFRDAHIFPVHIISLKAIIIKGKEKRSIIREINKNVYTPFAFFDFELGKFSPGNYKIFASLKISIHGKEKTIERFNLKGLKQKELNVKILEEKIPKPLNYIAGETHAHTYFSADPVEFGVSPKIFQEAAKALGLDFVFCTDHSYDFAFSENNYMERTDANARYNALKKEIEQLPDYPKMIPGEEVSTGNSEGRNVHMLLPGNTFYVEGEGDCGRKWLNNKPTNSIENILSRTELPCFAAHPKEIMSSLEKFIFRRGNWTHNDLCLKSRNPIKGLEFWNGIRDKGFKKGREFWISELELGNYLLPIGGNDAHGDLNEYTGVKIPLFMLKRSHSHIFGKVRTVIYGKDPLQAFKQNNLYITDGPALWWHKIDKTVVFTAKSSADFGKIKSFLIFAQKKPKEKEALFSASFEKKDQYEISTQIDMKTLIYARAELETELGCFALTSACPAI